MVALRVRGWAERELFMYAEARDSLNRAVRVARRHALAGRLAEALTSRSSLSLELGRSGAALRDIEAAHEALGGASTIELDSQEALIEMKFGHHIKAVEIGQRARARIDPSTDPINQTVLLVNLGESLSHLGRWREADEVFVEAAAVAERVGRLYLGMVIQTHASAIVRAGRLTEGLAYFDRAEALLVAAGWPLGEHYLERIESLVALRLLDEADDTVRRATHHFERAGMVLLLAEVRLRQARQCLSSGRVHEAAAAAVHAADLFRRQRRRGYALQADLVAVEARFGAGAANGRDLRTAMRAADALETAGALIEAVDADLLIARLAHRLGRVDEARARFARVSRMSRSGGSLLRVKGALADALSARLDGAPTEVARAARRGLDEIARFRTSLPTTELRALASGHGVELASLGLTATLRSGRVDRVLDWMERSRLASVLTEPPRPADAVLDELFAQLRIVSSEQRSSDVDVDRLARLRTEQARLEIRIQRRARSVGHTVSAATSVASASEITTVLVGSLVEFGVVDGRLIALTLGSRRQLWMLGSPEPAVSELSALLFGLRRLVTARRSNTAAAARAGIAHSLALLDELLVAPLNQALDHDVVIVPSASLFAVPWHALPSLASRRVSVAPSATVWARAAAGPGAGRGQLIAAGPSLDGAIDEVRSLATLYDEPTVVVPPNATVAAVRTGLDGAGLAHLACHGAFRSDNPSFSSLEFSDGPLTVLDLEMVGQTPDVVVLASCDSGASQALPGDELRGFLSALFMLGTRSVVASAVPVPDVASTPLMMALHRGLASGLGVGAALDQARGELDTETPEGFVLATAFAQFGVGSSPAQLRSPARPPTSASRSHRA